MRCFSAPAKVNFFLKITGRREDGYHLLESGMTFFPWFDRLEVACTAGGEITLECQPEVTEHQEENLVYRAALKLQRQAGIRQGAHLRLFKDIPQGAGLGGGSSDAAVVLLALNRMWGLDWPLRKLGDLGLELGADIPFFLGGRSARVSGIGERLLDYSDCPELELVVVYPDVALATAAVYRGITEPMLAEWAGRGVALVDGHDWGGVVFQNDLQRVACRLTATIADVGVRLRNHGAVVALMSGSGSAVFGVFEQESKARQACEAIIREHPMWRARQGRTFHVHPFDGEWQSGI